MIRLREARTDADLDAWIGVRRVVLPNESGGTVELLRAQDRPERLLLLAERFGLREIDRQVEQVKTLAREGRPPVPPGVEVLAWAAAGGYREVVTWTQQGNHAMRRLNELLGYVDRDVSVTMLAPLPLP